MPANLESSAVATGLEKVSFHSNPKEMFNAQTSPSQSSTVSELRNFQMFKLELEKSEEQDQIANICWIIKKAREFQKNIYFCFIDYSKAFM